MTERKPVDCSVRCLCRAPHSALTTRDRGGHLARKLPSGARAGEFAGRPLRASGVPRRAPFFRARRLAAPAPSFSSSCVRGSAAALARPKGLSRAVDDAPDRSRALLQPARAAVKAGAQQQHDGHGPSFAWVARLESETLEFRWASAEAACGAASAGPRNRRPGPSAPAISFPSPPPRPRSPQKRRLSPDSLA